MRVITALFVLGFACACVLGCNQAGADQQVRDGDIVFQNSKSAQSLAIQRATRSPYSHMGMIVQRDGQPFVLEATDTVRYTPLDAWIKRGEGAHFVVKRLRGVQERMTPETVKKAKAVLKTLEGKSHDLTFEWSDDRMYCSELVWKFYERASGVHIGELQKLRDFDLSDPEVSAKLHERYGDSVPLDEPVISPVAMFNSPLLELIVQR